VNFDDQMRRYFGTSDLSAVAPGAIEAGVDRMKVELGLEQDRGRRFALWSLLYTLGAAPDLVVAFKDEQDRYAARNLMELFERAEERLDVSPAN
jgi:RNAse (barnase) inhibitor barstar